MKMNKNEFLKCIEKYNLPKKEFVILSGGSLLLRDIKKTSHDIDIVVTEQLEKYLLNYYDNVEIEWYDEDSKKNVYIIDNVFSFSSNLDHVLENSEYEIINGYQVQTLDSIITMKQKLGRKKDLKDIEIIKNYLNIKNINSLALAYLGDSIYEVYIRNFLINKGIVKVNELQKEAISYVSAKKQSEYITKMIDKNFLLEDEIQIIKRARNHKSHASKSTDIRTYKNSTGLEALIGYLYLTKKEDRIIEIMKFIVGD